MGLAVNAVKNRRCGAAVSAEHQRDADNKIALHYTVISLPAVATNTRKHDVSQSEHNLQPCLTIAMGSLFMVNEQI
jgi:hypothetical protein